MNINKIMNKFFLFTSVPPYKFKKIFYKNIVQKFNPTLEFLYNNNYINIVITKIFKIYIKVLHKGQLKKSNKKKI